MKTDLTKPAALFKSIKRTFEEAEEACGGCIDRFYKIGGYIVRLRFSGPALVAFISSALQHLTSAPVKTPELTVCLFDSASTGVNMPPPPWSPEDYLPRGEVHGYKDEHIHTIFQPWSGVLNMIDMKADLAFYWISDASQVPYYETGAPLQTILHIWMQDHGRLLVHAGAVGTAEGGVLFAGKGGSGKSTIALACLNSDLFYAGDDYILLADDPMPFAYSLYNSGKLDSGHIHSIAHLSSIACNSERSDGEKILIFLQDHFPDKIISGFPIRAILLPSITGTDRVTLTPTSPAMALKALAPSTIFQLPEAGPKTFYKIAKLVKLIPCYTLEMGPDLSKVPSMILRLSSGDCIS
ncbi:serine kinase [Thermodesulfobacteriota bacterium]